MRILKCKHSFSSDSFSVSDAFLNIFSNNGYKYETERYLEIIFYKRDIFSFMSTFSVYKKYRKDFTISFNFYLN